MIIWFYTSLALCACFFLLAVYNAVWLVKFANMQLNDGDNAGKALTGTLRQRIVALELKGKILTSTVIIGLTMSVHAILLAIAYFKYTPNAAPAANQTALTWYKVSFMIFSQGAVCCLTPGINTLHGCVVSNHKIAKTEPHTFTLFFLMWSPLAMHIYFLVDYALQFVIKTYLPHVIALATFVITLLWTLCISIVHSFRSRAMLAHVIQGNKEEIAKTGPYVGDVAKQRQNYLIQQTARLKVSKKFLLITTVLFGITTLLFAYFGYSNMLIASDNYLSHDTSPLPDLFLDGFAIVSVSVVSFLWTRQPPHGFRNFNGGRSSTVTTVGPKGFISRLTIVNNSTFVSRNSNNNNNSNNNLREHREQLTPKNNNANSHVELNSM